MLVTGLYTVWLSVAPRAGAWIEIRFHRYGKADVIVAPRAGAWIEMFFKG